MIKAMYDVFAKRLNNEIKGKGKSQNAICKDLGISKQKLSNWKTGYTEPDLRALVTLADYFDVSVDYLLGRGEEKNRF